MRGSITENSLFVGMLAATAAGVLIVLSVIVSTAIWPIVAGAL